MNIVMTSITLDGVIRNKFELLTELKKNGHNIIVITPIEKEKINILEDQGFHYYPISIQAHGKNPFKDFGLYKAYMKVYRSICPDIVISMTIKPNVYSGLACEKLHIPYIATINGIGDAIYNGGLLGRLSICLLKLGLKNASYVVFQNQENRALFLNNRITTGSKAVLVPGSGINLVKHPFEKYLHVDEPLILTFIGRLSKDKGVHELVEAYKKLYEENHKIELNIVGSCPDNMKPLIDEAKGLGIKYYGRVDSSEIHSIIRNSHAVILPSYHEGISNVLLESGATGRPIIASDVEGCKETFDDGISGIAFKPKSADEIYSAVLKFINMTHDQKMEMGKAARKKIESEFDRNIVTNKYMDLIKNITK